MGYNKSMYRWWSGAACHISLLSLVMMTLKEGCLILFNASLRKRVFPSFLCLSFSPPPFAPDERRRLRLVVRDERSIKIRHIVDVGSRIQNHVWTHRHEKNDDDTSGVVLSPTKQIFNSIQGFYLRLPSLWSSADIFKIAQHSALCHRAFFDSPNRYRPMNVWGLDV